MFPRNLITARVNMCSNNNFETSCIPKIKGCDTWFGDDEALNLLAKQYELFNDEYGDIDFYVGVRAIVIGFSNLLVQAWREHLEATKPSQISNCIVEAYFMYRGGVDVVRDEIKSKFAPRRLAAIPTTSVYLYTQRKLFNMFNTKINSSLTMLLACKLYAHKIDTFEQSGFVKQFGPKTFHRICQLCKDNDRLAIFAKHLKIQFPDALKQIFPGSGTVPVSYTFVQPQTSEEDGITTIKNCEVKIRRCVDELKHARRMLKNSSTASSVYNKKRKHSDESDDCSNGKIIRRRIIISSEDEDNSTGNNSDDVQVLKEVKRKRCSAKLKVRNKRKRKPVRSSFIIDEAEEIDDEETEDEEELDDEETEDEEDLDDEEKEEELHEDEEEDETGDEEETEDEEKTEEDDETEKEEIEDEKEAYDEDED